jgi:hypothetical protein
MTVVLAELAEGLAYRDAVAGRAAAGLEVPDAPRRLATGERLEDLLVLARRCALLHT